MSFYNIYRLDLRKAAAKITGTNGQLITRSPLPRSPDRIDYGLSCNDLYNIVLIMLDSLPDIEEDFSNLALFFNQTITDSDLISCITTVNLYITIVIFVP